MLIELLPACTQSNAKLVARTTLTQQQALHVSKPPLQLAPGHKHGAQHRSANWRLSAQQLQLLVRGWCVWSPWARLLRLHLLLRLLCLPLLRLRLCVLRLLRRWLPMWLWRLGLQMLRRALLLMHRWRQRLQLLQPLCSHCLLLLLVRWLMVGARLRLLQRCWWCGLLGGGCCCRCWCRRLGCGGCCIRRCCQLLQQRLPSLLRSKRLLCRLLGSSPSLPYHQ